MAKPYTILELYKMHDCESATGWTTDGSTIEVDSDCKEGKYSLKQVSTLSPGIVEYTFTPVIDISTLTHLRFWIKGDDCTFIFVIFDSADNWDQWVITMPQASWVFNTEVIATPENSSAGAVDYTDIKKIRLSVAETGKTIYFDYIIAYKDITTNCFKPEVHRKIYEISKGYFKSTLDISDNFCIEIYDENDNLRFEGNIKDRKYGNIKEYFLEGFDKVIGSKVSGDYTTSTVEVIAKALIDQVSYLRYITGSITTVAGDHTIKITERPFIEQLRKLADLFDGIGVISPDGVVYLDDGSTQCSEPEIFEATHNFIADTVGSAPSGWTDDSTSPPQVTVQSSYKSHKKVVKFADSGDVNRAVLQIHFSDHISGTIDIWICKRTTANHNFAFNLYEDNITTHAVYLYITGENIGFGGVDTGFNITDDIWHHFRIDFNCATDTATLFFDGVEIDTDRAFLNAVDSIDSIDLRTDWTSPAFNVYIDSVGFSWDPNYTVGDNLNGFVANGKHGLLANNPLLQLIGLPINHVTGYGRMDMDTGLKLKSIAENLASQKQHGILPYSFRAPHINTQTELDALVITTLSKKSLSTSPRVIEPLKLYHLYYLDALFIGRTISFKLDIKGYTIYDYNILDTYWRGESTILELYLSSGLLHPSEHEVSDATVDEHQQDEMGGEVYKTDINTVDLVIWLTTASDPSNYYYRMDHAGVIVTSRLFVGDDVDDLRDVKIIWTFRREDNLGDTIDGKWNVTTNKTDGSTNNSNNIENGTIMTIPACAQYKYRKKTYVLDALDINPNELVQCQLELNEDGRTIHIYNCSAKYYIKRS
ncbi:MAG: adhesin [Lokiarchaeia virus VerdaV1]|uniref:Adhesin n=1 Tax=Lokiarchaeia virus VerdaV1 TaxID=3070170 RepID=A0AA35CRH7_9CAUD|nr:MAG: adhesin [Lokiarchaeia virus VerdaV1]BDI54865.1 MAG: adhesin [Lokiarchaeia virus VerdaV1]